MRVFLDSSALVKKYVVESGSDYIEELLAESEEAAVSIICIAEIISTLNRLIREKKIKVPEYQKIIKQFESDLQDLYVCNISVNTIRVSKKLLEENRLRAMDSLHLASSMIWGCDFFATYDRNQQSAAVKNRLKTNKL